MKSTKKNGNNKIKGKGMGVNSQPSRRGVRSQNGSSRKAAPVSKALNSFMAKPPKMVSTGDSSVVTHKEFVADVTGHTAFTALSFPINAGRDTLFRWLSDIAARYERYQFLSLRFRYEPRCSTATAGTVIIAADYDALDSAPANKQDVYNYHHCAQSSAWDECCFDVDPSILKTRGVLFMRTGAAPSGSDLKTYDLGNLWLCVSGFSGAVVCGELFVEYCVRLITPQIADNTQSRYLTATAGLAAGALFGTNTTLGAGNLDLTVTSASTITLNQNWEGLISINLNGTGLAVGGFVSSGSVVCTLVSELANAAATAMLVTVRIPKTQGIRNGTIVLAVTATTVTAMSSYWSAYDS